MIIVDTNVLISGLITNNSSATTARILDAMIVSRIRPLLSPALLDEYRAVLLRPAIVERHGLAGSEIDDLLSAIVHHAIWREPSAAGPPAPDAGDGDLWALLESEPTAQLITGDLRLIGAAPFEARVLRVDQYEFPSH